MISWVVVFEGRVMGVVDDDTYQWLLESCVKFSQTVVVVEEAACLRTYALG